MQRRRLLQALPLGLLASAVAAATEAVVVDIRDHKYLPPTLQVKVGTTVRWTNSEKRSTHSVRFLGAGGVESERFFPGEFWERRFEQPGTYPYVCGPHPEMAGSITVTP